MLLNIPSQLTDDELVAKVKTLAECERRATADLIVHLAELDTRGLYLGAGFQSLYQYCREVLHLSEHAVYNRIAAARAARRFPVVVGLLERGDINLTTVKVLAPHMTEANHQELLGASAHKTRLEVEELVAQRFPQPDAATSIRKLARVTPLAADRYEIRFTASRETLEKLRTAQDLLRHAVPSGDAAEIFDRALTALLEQTTRRKLSATNRPRPARAATPHSRDIPAHVQRQVWERDGGRCAFVAKDDGRRCGERGFVEFHHAKPWTVGGPPTVENIELRCAAHNRHEADLYFGPIAAARAIHH
jgi:hypothetical protein